MLEDFFPDYLANKSNIINDYIKTRKHHFEQYEEKGNSIKKKKKELNSFTGKLSDVTKKNEIYDEKIKRLRKEQQVLNNMSVNINEMSNTTQITINQKKYESISLLIEEIMGSLEKHQNELHNDSSVEGISEYEIVDIETNIDLLNEEVEANLNNLSVLKNNLYRIIEFERNKLKTLVKKWDQNHEQCKKIKEDNLSINDYKTAVRNEILIIRKIEQTIRNYAQERSEKKVKMGFCRKCDGNGCIDCNNGFVDIENE
jgi:hypothetical protein